jgi:hypothetical protein
MNPAATDMAAQLATLGLGTVAATSGWGIFIGWEPDRDTVPSTITLYDIGEGKPDTAQSRSVSIDHPQVQIRTRDATYKDSYAKCKACCDGLRGVSLPLVLNGASYRNIQRTFGPMFLERDKRERYIWVATLSLIRESV